MDAAAVADNYRHLIGRNGISLLRPIVVSERQSVSTPLCDNCEERPSIVQYDYVFWPGLIEIVDRPINLCSICFKELTDAKTIMMNRRET